MMNVLALGLVLTSLVTAGFFSPNPEKQNVNPKQDDVIVKEGHRVVVVEFEKDDGNTKVLIAPQDTHEKGYVANAKEKVSQKVEDIKDGFKEASSSSVLGEDDASRSKFNPKELVCDAYGKCKHKIATAIGKTKDKAHEVADKAYEVEEGAKGAVGDAVGKVKDTASEVSSEAKDKVVEMKEGAKERLHDAIDSTKSSVSGAKEKAKEVSQKVEDASNKVKEETKKELGEILHRAREVVVDVLGYLVPTERLASMAGVLHLMGFAAAYGMCVWVTFASSYVLAGALPRHQFAMVQSKIYPTYFKAMSYSLGLALVGHLMRQKRSGSTFGFGIMFHGLNLVASLVMTLVNLLYLEPRATKVMFERMKKEKEEGRGKEGHTVDEAAATETTTGGRDTSTGGRATTTTTTRVEGATMDKPAEAAIKSQVMRLSEILRRLNSYSSFLNVLTLMSLTWHLVHLGQRLNTVC